MTKEPDYLEEEEHEEVGELLQQRLYFCGFFEASSTNNGYSYMTGDVLIGRYFRSSNGLLT